jgi:uncharacterized integral membrane protein
MTNVRMDQCVISFRLLLIWLMLMFVVHNLDKISEL